MPSREILTLQLGHYANFVGTHWWNIQESGFEYSGSAGSASDASKIDHNVLYREGLTPKGQLTFTPRLLLVDLKDSLRTLSKAGDLYESPPDTSQLFVEWENCKIDLQEKQREPKNEFQIDIDNSETLSEVTEKKYNLEEKVTVWSDYLYTRFHPRTVNVINEYQHCNNECPFDSFSVGHSLWKNEFFEEEFSDKIRSYVEECDYFQGFHMLSDCTNGFAGLSSACLEHLRDEFERKSVLVVPTIPSYFPDNDYTNDREQVQSIMNDSIRVINLLLSFNSYRQLCSMFVPLCTSEDGWRQPGKPREFYHTKYNHKLPYHSSALLASALETATLKYRLKDDPFSLPDLCADMTANGRHAVAGSVCLPFSMNLDADFIDCLDDWQGPLYKSITPRCTIGTDRFLQHLMIRGIPESRLKKPPNRAGKQKEMAAYKCNSVKEMIEFYLSCTTYATASNVSVLEKPMPTKNPYPDIFDKSVGFNGNIISSQRPEDIRVDSIPILAGFHSGSEIGEMLESLHSEAAKLKIGRFHQFTIDKDEYAETLNDILMFRENYEDSYLV